MKKLLFLVFLLLNSVWSYAQAQPTPTQIEQHLSEYFTYYKTSNWEAYIELTYLDEVTKAELLKEAATDPQDTSLNTSESIQMTFDSLIYVSPLVTHDSIAVLCLQYTYHISLDFSEQKGEGGLNLALAYGMESLRQTYGRDQVTFDEETTTIHCAVVEEVYYIKLVGPAGWKFLSPTMNRVYSLIPDSVLEQL